MPAKTIAKFINPWKLRRDNKQLRFEALRSRDGDNCRRCKRPMSFDLPPGHDKAPTIEQLSPRPKGGASRNGESGAFDNLCLCHRRCNPDVVDHTAEVLERMRLRA